MKDFKVLNITQSTMEITLQDIAIVELSELKYLNITLPSGKKPFTFSPSGETYIFDLNSMLFQEIENSVQNEQNIQLDPSEFIERVENKTRSFEKIHYHNLIRLI